MKLWSRYYVRTLIQHFLLYLGIFSFLYVLIDYATHAKVWGQEAIPKERLIFYYGAQISRYLDILAPLSLLLATLKIGATAQIRGEFTALRAGGISCKRLSLPFLSTALGLVLLLGAHTEWVQPHAFLALQQFEQTYLKTHHTSHKIQGIPLADRSWLLCHASHIHHEKLQRVFWIRSSEEIYSMGTLFLTPFPHAEEVDVLLYEPGKGFHCTAHHANLPLPEMPVSLDHLKTPVIEARWQSLSALAITLKNAGIEAERFTWFLYKLLSPFIGVLAVLGVLPWCFHFSRRMPLFRLYVTSLFGFITFLTLFHAAAILGESETLPPLWSLLTPPGLTLLCFGKRYVSL